MVGAFERAIELDPGYAEAYAGFAMAYALDFQNHWSDTPDPLALAARFTAQALEKGPNESYVHYVASVVAMWQKDLARSKAEAEAALALNANFARAYGVLGLVEVYLGSPLAAIPYIERARRLDPVMTHQYLHFLGSAYLVAGQYEAAAATFRERIRLSPETDLSRALLASALGHLGEFEEARQVWQDLRTVNPKYSFADHLSRLPIQNPADAERIRTGVLKAGLLDPVPAEVPPPT
jgi:adenylate cyclase